MILAAAAAGVALRGGFPVADSALFEYFGRAILQGEHLYLDIWDNKLPPIYYVNALWQFLFGADYRLHAVAEVCVASISSALFAWLMRAFALEFCGPAAGMLAIMLCIALPLNSVEGYALPLQLAALLAAKHGKMLLSAALAAAAATFWLPGVLMLIPLAAIRRERTAARAAFAIIFLFVLAIIVLISAGIAPLPDLLRSWFAYASPPQTYELHRHVLVLNWIAPEWSTAERFWYGSVGSGFLPLALILLAVSRKPDNATQRWGLLWLSSMCAAAFVGTRFYDHYFIPALPALLFSICAYAPETAVRGWRFAVLGLGVAAFVKTFSSIAAGDDVISSRTSGRIQAGARPLVANRLTLGIDSYKPELYLALDPVLRSRFEIVIKSQGRAFQANLRLPRPAVFVETKIENSSGRRVCLRTAAPWRVFVDASEAPAFDRCQ